MKRLVHVIAPSNTMADLPDPMVQIGIKRLESLGFEPRISQYARHRYRYLSGTIAERLSDLQNALADPMACGVMSVFGGYNSNDLLEGIKQLSCPTPKWFIGYSDITALLAALSEHSLLRVIHGPGFASFCDPNFFQFSQDAFLAAAHAQEMSFSSPDFFASDLWFTKKNYGPREIHKPCAWQVFQHGEVAAKIMGGNLDTLCALLGTPYFPDLQDKILFLETASGEPGPFQRGLMQLKHAGIFKQISGLIIGIVPAGSPLHDSEYLLSILKLLDLQSYPVIYNAHCAHVDPMLSIPINQLAKLSTIGLPTLTINYSGTACS